MRLLASWADDDPDGQYGAAATGTRGADPGDPGVPVLCAVVTSVSRDRRAQETVERAATVWARSAGRGRGHPGLYDSGLAGTLVGLRMAARIHPALAPVGEQLAARLTRRVAEARPRPPDPKAPGVTFPDYDLALGPSGTLLALCTGQGPQPGELAPLVRRLVRLSAGDGLPGLRASYAGHPHLDWLDGCVNTGMAHGVAGVLAALTAAVRRPGQAPADAAGALRKLGAWLVEEAFTDARGVVTWDGAGADGRLAVPGARARQAWCYGTPGVSWALWDAADAVGDRAGATFAAEAFTSLAERYDTDFHLLGTHLGDRLALCHGASGVLAVADAFHRHAGLPAATVLRSRLLAYLRTRLTDLEALAGERTSLLTGASGAWSALLTAEADAARDWLPALGLR
ncbi:lanthionine synthetase LanC family protein [Streptomyces iconiensis]|uniref:Lanthionine synthetase LanC family protein n=1 Tax=Streptomyces iconiensis TaxID=1384038 RepID=A0ABT6ZQI7_9ACTN|nr:lanthionine synthetase LanC family protein [Streptomyces iconiensis]MDJ1130946.1 lanthionine synthetase LanC family protein [Streptomyces iconiensis]